MFLRSAILFLLLGGLGLAEAQAWEIQVETPAFATVTSSAGRVYARPEKGRLTLSFPNKAGEPQSFEVRGPLGGIVRREVSSSEAGVTLRFEPGILASDDPNPPLLPHLPELCPRLERVKYPGKGRAPYIYRGEEDALNRFPLAQMTDPDHGQARQAQSVTGMDGRNALLLKAVRIRYDYEDDGIVDFQKVDASGKAVEIREGRGGFYANFHYAVLPYSAELAALPQQALLHLALGSLDLIGQGALRPALRTHAFLPGPFLSRNHFSYPLCEWGDTAHQAPEQHLEYRGMALWDWDYQVLPQDRVLLIVWEGDEEGQAVAEGRIAEHELIDDLVGVFEVSRSASLRPLTLKNARGDFEITVQTGDIPAPPAPQAPSLAPLAQHP